MPEARPDPRPAPRVRDPALLRRLHLRRGHCLVCGRTTGLSLHHVLPRSRGGDDDERNLIFLHGSGTTGCHGLIEAHDAETCAALGRALPPETVAYVLGKLGDEPGRAWLERRYALYSPPRRPG